MLGVKKRATPRKKKVRVASFDTFSQKERGDGILFGTSANCDCRDGLQRGVGLTAYRNDMGNTVVAPVNLRVRGAYLLYLYDGTSNVKRLFLHAGEDYLYVCNPADGTAGRRRQVSGAPMYACVQDGEKRKYHLFGGSSEVFCTEDGETYVKIRDRDVRGLCVCGERCFTVSNDGLYYTAAGEPTKTEGKADEGGVLYPPLELGEPIGVATMGGKVYLFTEYAIFRLTVSAKASDFFLERLDYDGGRICRRSMAATEKGILFLSMTGIYFLRGDSAKRVCEHIPLRPTIENNCCRVGYCGDMVLIEFKEQSYGIPDRRLALYADGSDGFYVDVYGELGGNGYCFMNKTLYCFAKNPEDGLYSTLPYFKSEKIDFGTRAKKSLQALRFVGEGGVQVRVECGSRVRTYAAEMTKEGVKVRTVEKGEDFQFIILPEAGARLDSMQVEYVIEE